MCGIIGYTGPLDAREILLEGLSQLEYRGYDSAGIAFFTMSSRIVTLKKTGKVSELKKLCRHITETIHCGIGHTRWATHGGVTDENSHPHTVGRVTLIHNGIIENYHQLSTEYQLHGSLLSQTDSEVAAAVLNHLYQGNPVEAIRKLLPLLEGSYGFCIMFEDYPGEIYAVRNISPLVAASTSSGALIASDLTALLPYTREYFVIPEKTILRMTPYQIQLMDLSGKEIRPEPSEINWNMEAAMKQGFPHFMLKEIHEQPDALKNTIFPRLNKGMVDFSQDGIPDEVFSGCSRLHIVACGTAMHAGMAARSLMEPLLRIPVTVSVASEFRYEEPLIDDKTLVIIISQSGETIDTLAAMRMAKVYKARVLSIVNVKGSTIARESDYVLYTHAGPEIAVASTKAYTVQLAALYLISCKMAWVRHIYDSKETANFLELLLDAIPAMETILRQKDRIKEIVAHIQSQPDAFFIGRGLDYALSMEGALKLKEISYIHAEAYSAGELKHGTIALITDLVPVIAIATQEKIYAKTLSNVKEVKARGAFVILLTKEKAIPDPELADIHLTVPGLDDRFTVFPVAAILQLIAYYTSVGKDLDVDKPRNLAKSVTVE